jgi:branched-chain amino acid transport system substrate-binding protein
MVISLGLSLLLCMIGAFRVIQPLLTSHTAVPAANSLTIVSDLPLSGAEQTQPIVRAMQLRLHQANGQACGGRYTVRYEAWDDASPSAGAWDPAVETANARKAAADSRIIAYLGPFNSGAAKLSIPILDQAGPLVMISLGNTDPGLTKPTGAAPGEPDVYYPAHVRNYVRLTTADDVQGSVAARFIHDQLKARTVYILDDHQLYGTGIADAFQAAAGPIGLAVLGRASIDPNASDYQTLMGNISLSNGGRAPDAIFVGMLVDNNASQVLKDKFSLMGDNMRVKYVGPAGIRVQAFIDGAGPRVAEGVYASQPGLPFDQLPALGQQFKRDYDAKYGGQLNDVNAAYGYEAMNVALAAIEAVCAAGGDPADRRAVRDAVFNIKNFHGVLGAWSFDPNGDISLTGTTFYQVKRGQFVLVGP